MSESHWQDVDANTRFRSIFGGREVLITGGLGFIGSNLASQLVGCGAHVSIIDSLIPLFGGSVANVQEIRDHIAIDFADLRDIPSLERAVRGKHYIFHLAGQVSHGDSMRDPQLDLEVNCVSTMNLVEACRRHNPSVRMLYTSTRQVYGRPHRLPVTEEHPTLPIDVNGINKLAAEYYHLLYHSVYGVRSTVLRLTNTYGPRQRLDSDRQGVAAVFIHRALQGETIHLFGGGNQRRDFNYVDDVVDAMLLAISTEECHGRVFNLGARRAHTLMQFAQILQRLCGCRIVSAPFPDEGKLIDIGDYFGDCSALTAATGWQPSIDLEQGLNRTVAFYRNPLKASQKESLAVP